MEPNNPKSESRHTNNKDPNSLLPSQKIQLITKNIGNDLKAQDDRVSSVNYNPAMSKMITIAISQVKTLGFQKFRASSVSNKYSILFAITNPALDVDARLRTFPVAIDIYDKIFSVRVIFSVNNEPFKFTDENLEAKILEFIARANWKIKIGIFGISSEKRFLTFELKSCYLRLDHTYLGEIIRNSIDISITAYKFYSQKIVKIIDLVQQGLNCDIAQLIKTDPINQREIQEEKKDSIKSLKKSSQNNTDLEILEQSEKPNANPNLFQDEHKILDFIQNNDNLCLRFDLDNLIIDKEQFIYEGYENSTFEKYIKIFKIDIDIIEIIIIELLELYRNHLEFKKFPSKNILVKNFAPNLDIKFIPVNISNIALINPKNNNERLYEIKMRKDINDLLVSLMPTKIHTKFFVTEYDFIHPNYFEMKDITSVQNSIGGGGFGEVFINELNGKQVAIKFPKEGKENQEKTKLRIEKELQMMKILPHDNIIAVYGVVNHKSRLGLVMEYCKYGGFNDFLKENQD